nr:zinc-binding dehydrogenase [Brevibacterium daeguense]
MVLGAGGTVGTYVVQLAKKLGATVIGHATGDRLEHLESLGIDRTVDYRAHEFDDPALPGGPIREVDVVVDLIGGEYAVRAVPLTRRDGLVVGVPSGQQQGLGEAATSAGVRWTSLIVEPDHVALTYIADLIENGELEVTPPQVAPLEDVVDVHRKMAAGRMSKTVLKVNA